MITLKKSLFFKIMMMNMILIIVSVFLVTIICINSIGSYIIRDNLVRLQNNAERICDLTIAYTANSSNSFMKSFYESSLETTASSTNSTILILNEDSKIFARTKLNSMNINTSALADNPFVKNVLSGDYLQRTGTLNGLFDRTALSVGMPIQYGSQIIGAVIIAVPSPKLQSIKYDFLVMFIFAAIIAIVISFVMSYFLSKRISRPLKAMNDASKKIAAGKFDQRVSVDVKDKVSEIGMLVDTFNSMADSLEHIEEQRRTFISSVSHELRTPMTSIIGFVEGILDGTIPQDKQEQYLSVILGETKRLSRLVTELLDLSRIERGDLLLQFSKTEINEIIRQQLIRFEQDIINKKLDVSVEFYKDECFCSCDKDAITRVIINLLDNAVKFTNPEGYIKISVKEVSHHATISIENSGDGIPPEDLKHIFEKFYKTDKSRGLDKKGMGLGLYLVKNIIGQHGETIQAESEEGKFVRFTFSLSLAKESKKATTEPAPKQ